MVTEGTGFVAFFVWLVCGVFASEVLLIFRFVAWFLFGFVAL